MQPDRNAPDYIEAVIAKKPHEDDPKDIRIRNIIAEKFLQEDWARQAFKNIRQEQIDYLRDVVNHVEDPDYVNNTTQKTLKRIAEELYTDVEEGAEQLRKITPGTPVLIMTNHLGTYKLSGINPQRELGEGVDIYDGYDFMYPYPLYFAALYPVAERIGDKLSYTSDDFPGVYGRVHSEAGFIHVPPASVVQTGRIEVLKQQTQELITKQPNTAVVNFPEGGTSGKYNEAGPYDLLEFKTGGYVIAAELGMTVVPVAQYFDPQQGMRLKIFEPFKPQPTSREHYQAMASQTQLEMQAWLTYKESAQTLPKAA